MSGRGLAPESLEIIESARRILEAVHPATVRGVCYQLFTQGVIDSMSTKNVKNVSRLLVVARENGTIPWSHIVDETRQEERVSAWSGLGEFGDTVTGAYRKDFWSHQPAWLKVFSEKATIGGVIRPVLKEFAVSFQVMHGYGSATSIYDVATESLDGDTTLEILYVGDFDPSGMHMSEVDLPERIERYGGAVEITRIALERSDCARLPSFEAETKRSDPRYGWFKANYGATCWELDAMNPNDLRARVRTAIWNRIDVEAWQHCKRVEDAEKASLNSYIKAWPRG